jgi:hypothetical protein
MLVPYAAMPKPQGNIMKYSLILAAALLALPAAASDNHDNDRDICSMRAVNGNWVYYSVAGGASPYTITCSLHVASGTITNGMCVQSGGAALTASGSLAIANAMTHHDNHHMQKPLKSVDRQACSITGTITYAGANLTETLTNLTLANEGDEIVGVGTNGTGLLSVTFVGSRQDK